MLDRLIKLCVKISVFFNWDILWNIIRRLTRSERIYLAFRMLRDEVELYTFRRNNITWTTYGWDLSMTWSLMEHGHFQGNQIHAVLDWLKYHHLLNDKNKILIDVGANIGTTSIPFAVNTDCHVLAIEPFPDNFALLERNIAQNHLGHRITCVQSAVYDKTGPISMIMPERVCGDAIILQKPYSKEQSQHHVDVPAAGLMDILATNRIIPERVGFVWSDTEGSEAKVIKTGDALWLSGIPLYIEVYPKILAKQGAVQDLKQSVVQYFSHFITIETLMKAGFSAEALSVSHFSNFFDQLDRINDLTDVLLLPIGFKFK